MALQDDIKLVEAWLRVAEDDVGANVTDPEAEAMLRIVTALKNQMPSSERCRTFDVGDIVKLKGMTTATTPNMVVCHSYINETGDEMLGVLWFSHQGERQDCALDARLFKRMESASHT